MSTAVTVVTNSAIEQVLINGDLKLLSVPDRLQYYKSVCESMGLNPLTRPFEYITLNGKLTFYARKDCADQLRSIHAISVTIPSREVLDGIYVVTARATRKDGRCDEATGAVPIESLKGEAKANAFMKAETKAKRRVTLSLCGLGILDESEIESIPGAVVGQPDIPVEVATPAQQRIAGKEAAQAVAQKKLEAIKAEPKSTAAEVLGTRTQFLVKVRNATRAQLTTGIKQCYAFLADKLGQVSADIHLAAGLKELHAKTHEKLENDGAAILATYLYDKLFANEPEPQEPALEALWARMVDIKSTVESLNYLKDLLGRHVGTEVAAGDYYRILGEQGVKHANEFKGDLQRSRLAARELWKLIEAENRRKEMEITEDDIPG